MDANTEQLRYIRTLFEEAERQGIFLWLESGWAIDARMGHITRNHEDIDIAFVKEQEIAYRALIETLGFDRHEETDYGFLSWCGDILLDSEPCVRTDGEYTFETFPRGSCPMQKEGILDGYPVRCVNWEAMYFEFLFYLREIPQTEWRDKDFQSLRLIESHLDEDTRAALQDLFDHVPETPLDAEQSRNSVSP